MDPPPTGTLPPPAANDAAAFVSDITLVDGTAVTPGQALTKIWRVKNTGSTTWGANHHLVFVGGNRMGAPSVVSVPNTAPNATADLSLNLTAPTQPGDYTGYWRLTNPQGTYFGPTLFISISVPGATPPPNTEAAIILSCVANCPAQVAPGETFRPTIRAKVNQGQLLATRGDMLRNTDGNLYGAYPHIAVAGTVNQYGTYDFTFYANNPIHAPTTPGTYTSKWRVWRDGNWAGPEYTLTFEVTASGNNAAPNPPSLTGPGDWAVYYGNTGITLSAQHNGDPDGEAIVAYQFDIQGAQLANSGWIAANTWSPSGLGFNGYAWRVKVKDARGAESGWSTETRNFSVLDNDPQIYDFHATACTTDWNQGEPEKVCFCSDTNAGTQRLMLNTASDGSTNGEWITLNEIGAPDYTCTSSTDRPPTLSPLDLPYGTYRARLYARRDGGWDHARYQDITINLPYAPYSSYRPGDPMLGYQYGSAAMRQAAQPTAGAYLTTRTVHFDWTQTLRTTGYRLEASDNATFSGPLLLDVTFTNNTTTDYTYTFPSDYATVYWRVTASGPNGSHVGGASFHIDETPPNSAVAALPAVVAEDSFAVTWGGTDARSGVRWYDIQVRDASRPNSVWVDWLVNTTKVTDLYQGQLGHTYYFRVRALDNAGNLEAWPADPGDAFTRIDPTAFPPPVYWNSAYGYRRNLTILNNDADPIPVGYPIGIKFNASTTPTAAEIYAAALSSGNDVRVVYQNQTELDRWVTYFSPQRIEIWFPAQAILNGNQTSTGDYQIYYGNPSAGVPPATLNNVFYPKPDANTMALWHMQEGSGTAVYDSSGRGHTGTLSNGGWGDGYLGYSTAYNGSTSILTFGNHPDFDNLTAMTIEMWLYSGRSGWGMPLFKGISGYTQYLLRINGNNDLEFIVGTGGGNQTLVSTEKILPGNWYHIAAVHDGGSNQWIYINGVLRGSKNNSQTPVQRNYGLYIGNEPWPNGMAFMGNVQHARISNIARTDFSYGKVNTAPSVLVGVVQTPPATGTPNLVFSDLQVFPNPTGGVLVQAVAQNQGTLGTVNLFDTDLYFDTSPSGPGAFGPAFWANEPISANTTLTLNLVITDPTTLGFATESLAPGAEYTSTVFGQIDPGNIISETNNQDNIFANGVELCLATADAYEGDDTVANATLLNLGGSQWHNFTTQSDEDWVKFNATAGVTYTLATSGLGPTADTYLYIYAADGTTLLASNDDAEGTLASQLEWSPPTTGVYYALVQQWNPNSFGCGAGYTLSFARALKHLYLPFVRRGQSN